MWGRYRGSKYMHFCNFHIGDSMMFRNREHGAHDESNWSSSLLEQQSIIF